MTGLLKQPQVGEVYIYIQEAVSKVSLRQFFNKAFVILTHIATAL
jgi:hypothetical protein